MERQVVAVAWAGYLAAEVVAAAQVERRGAVEALAACLGDAEEIWVAQLVDEVAG